MSYTLMAVNKAFFKNEVIKAKRNGIELSKQIDDLYNELMRNSGKHLTCLYVKELKGFLSLNGGASIYEPAGGMNGCKIIVESGLVEGSINHILTVDNTYQFKWK